MEKFNRRDFIRLGAMGSLALASRGLVFAEPQTAPGGARTFKMKFAPGRGNEVFRTIAGKDPLKRLQFFKDQGFIAVEGIVWISHKPLSDKEKQMQQDIGDLAKKLGLEVGCMSSMNEKDFPTMSANQVPSKEKVIRDKSAIRDFLVWQMDNTFDILKRVGSKTFIIGPGTVDKELSWNKQYDNVVENMAFCADYCKKNGFVMEIEPLNTTSHPNMFCDRAELGARICEDVKSPNCKILYDLFHEQMQVGNLDSLDNPIVWKNIESFHIADAPGRKEPGSGNMDYMKIFKKIWDKGFRGILGLEHGQSAQSAAVDEKILATYRAFDAQV